MRGILIIIAIVAASIVLPASAMAQAGPASCASPALSVNPAITTASPAQQIAVQRAAIKSATAEANATPLPAGATVVDCNVSVQTIGVPKGVQVTPSPAAAGLRARIRQSGSGSLGSIGCSMVGHVYYVSTPTYIHISLLWSCTAYYASMSGAGVVQTPSSGTKVAPFSQTSRSWSGSTHLEFSGVAWYGYHNRAVWEYGYFGFTGIGILYTQTTVAYI